MPDFFGVCDDIKVGEYWTSSPQPTIERSRRPQIIDDVLALTDLGVRRRPSSRNSRGMKQRLCLAKTLLHDRRCCSWMNPPQGSTRAPA